MSRPIEGLTARFKLWLSTDEAEGAFGDGKWRLLKAVDENGSLKNAAEARGISYRKAWGDIRKAEQCLGVSLIEKRHGGRTGGSTTLTPEGRKWMQAYGRFRTTVEKAVAKAHSRYIAELVDE